MKSVYVKREQVKEVLEATFPNFKGKNISVMAVNSVRFTGTNWDGGNRSVYRLLELATKKSYSVAEAPFLERSQVHEQPVKLPEGVLCVVHRQYGMRESIEILTPSNNLLPQLQQDTALTEDERTVLLATRCLKSSYGGVKNYRFQEARRKTGITEERYEAAKANLISKKLLNKAGAITPEGRNAVSGEYF